MDQDVIAIYDMLTNDTAYDKSCLSHARGVSTNMTALGDLIDTLGLAEFTPYARQLDLYKTGQMANLDQWMTYLYEEFPTNLGLMSSYINDMNTMSRLPGFDTPIDDTVSVAPHDPSPNTSIGNTNASSGGYVNLRGVSPRAMMLGAPMAFYAPDTGAGSGGASSPSPVGSNASGGKCASMGNAFGSIMGKSNQFMGQAMGVMGQIGGLVGGIASGGILGAVSKFANLGSMANIPGIGNLGGLASGGFSQIGQLGQIGSLISNIGSMANVGQLGQLGPMLGGSMQPLQQLGGLLTSMSLLNDRSTLLANPLGATNVDTVRQQLASLNQAIYTTDTTRVQTALLAVAAGLEALLDANATPGNVTNFIVQLRGLAVFLNNGRLAQVGDITPLLTDLTTFANSLTTYVQPSPDLTKLVDDINTLVSVLQPLNDINSLVTQVNTLNNSLYNLGGTYGYGNVDTTLAQAAGVAGRLQGLGGVVGMIPGLSGATGALGGVQGIVGALTSVSSGNLGGTIGGMTGLMGNMTSLLRGIPGLSSIMGSLGGAGGLGSILGGAGIGGLTGQLGGLIGSGGLGGIMGGVGSMISGERGMLGAAAGAMKIIAGAFNLKLLNGNGCAKSVMDAIGSTSLKSAVGGDGSGRSSGGSGSTGGDGTSASGSPSGTNDFTRQGTSDDYARIKTDEGSFGRNDFGFGGVQGRSPLFDPNVSGTTSSGFQNSVPNANTYSPAPEDVPLKGDRGVRDTPTTGGVANPKSGRLY